MRGYSSEKSNHSSSSGGNVPETQPQHKDNTAPSCTVPRKPSHAANLSLLCLQNAIIMGTRTQLVLCPPGRRNDLRRRLLSTWRKKKPINKKMLKKSNQGNGRMNVNLCTSSRSLCGIEERLNLDIVVGEACLKEYADAEEEWLMNDNINLLICDEENNAEEESSGDEDPLNLDFEEETLRQTSTPIKNDTVKENTTVIYKEPLYTLGAESSNGVPGNGAAVMGSASSGKLAFNFRKLRWFDAIKASDRKIARNYLKEELAKLKKIDSLIWINRLKNIQNKEFQKVGFRKTNNGEAINSTNKILDADTDTLTNTRENLNETINFPTGMTYSLSAALVLESLHLLQLESLDGMFKCYEGIVSAGTALLDADIDSPTNMSTGNKESPKAEIMNALAQILITNLEKSSGDTILSLAKLRKLCGTKRYQQRFVQRIAPALVRPPNAAMWCLRHQNDMEAILVATEMILDASPEVFATGWYEHGITLLADSKRAEILQTKAILLKRLAQQSSEGLSKGLSSGTSIHRWNLTSRTIGTISPKDGSSTTGTEILAEWEVLAVDQQIRRSINNLFTKDWSRVLLVTALASDGDTFAQPLRTRGISSAGGIWSSNKNQSKLSVSSVDGSHETLPPSLNLASPPRLSHRGKNPISLTSNTTADPHSPTFESPTRTPSTSHEYITEPSSPTEHDLSSVFGPPFLATSTSSSKSNIKESSKSGISPPHFSVRIPPLSPITPPPSASTLVSIKSSKLKIPSIAPPLASQLGSDINPPPSPTFNANEGIRTYREPPLSPTSSNHYRKDENQQLKSPQQNRLTDTSDERRRLVAACRALRSQISRFEDSFYQMHGRPPKGTAERAPLASTYAQYREWKRAIRADAASRIQALSRGARVRDLLLKSGNSRIKKFVLNRTIWPPAIITSLHKPITKSAEEVITLTPPIINVNPNAGGIEVGLGDPSLPKQYPSNMLYYKSLTTADLLNEKKKLKDKLKSFDKKFYQKNGRMPSKDEKEPIRHLYELYNALKIFISGREKERKGGGGRNGGDKDVGGFEGKGGEERRGTGIRRGGAPEFSNMISPKLPHSPIASQSERLADLKTEKQTLHQQLRTYEREFLRQNERQVSSYADIKPVAALYRRYKDIKKEIAALQESLRRL